MGVNDITGDRLVSKANTKKYEEGYDRIFKTIKDRDIEECVDKLEKYIDKCKDKK